MAGNTIEYQQPKKPLTRIAKEEFFGNISKMANDLYLMKIDFFQFNDYVRLQLDRFLLSEEITVTTVKYVEDIRDTATKEQLTLADIAAPVEEE